MRVLKSAALAALLFAVPALAHHDGEIFSAGALQVSHLWTEEVGPTAHAVPVYLTIRNTGTEADRLVGVKTTFSDAGKFEAPVLGADGALSVREIPAVEIAAGQTLTFQRGGITLVLDNVQRPLSAGQHVDMVLEFAKAGTVAVEVEIEEPHGHEGDHAEEAKPAI
jgi:copper(I)-binding protein